MNERDKQLATQMGITILAFGFVSVMIGVYYLLGGAWMAIVGGVCVMLGGLLIGMSGQK